MFSALHTPGTDWTRNILFTGGQHVQWSRRRSDTGRRRGRGGREWWWRAEPPQGPKDVLVTQLHFKRRHWEPQWQIPEGEHRKGRRAKKFLLRRLIFHQVCFLSLSSLLLRASSCLFGDPRLWTLVSFYRQQRQRIFTRKTKKIWKENTEESS